MSWSLELSKVEKLQKTPFSRRPGFKLGPLDLNVEDGEIVGLLGANGAGKTTTLKLLTGLLLPDAGTIKLAGVPTSNPSWRSSVGYLPEHPAFYEYLTGREFLRFAAELFGFDRSTTERRTKDLLEKSGIASSADKPIRSYSKGMQQRLGIAQALLNEPRILILDEPMSGLDPLGRRFVRDLMLELKSKGVSILFSTHIISDAEYVCDRVALMRQGRLTAFGTFDELLGVPSEFEIVCLRPTGTSGMERHSSRCSSERLSSVVGELIAQGAHLVSVTPVRASIEDLLAPEAPSKAEAR
jgi:ABC-2 type transport system ATP-binding protein